MDDGVGSLGSPRPRPLMRAVVADLRTREVGAAVAGAGEGGDGGVAAAERGAATAAAEGDTPAMAGHDSAARGAGGEGVGGHGTPR